jgi:hypothetical protein
MQRAGRAEGPLPSVKIDPPIVTPLKGRPPGRSRWRLGSRKALRTPGGRPWAWTLLWGGLALAASIRLATIAMDPIVATYRTSSEIRALNVSYQEAQTRNERLKRQIAHLNSRAGVEEEARRLGWVRAGEMPLLIVSQPATSHGAQQGTAASESGAGSRERGAVPQAPVAPRLLEPPSPPGLKSLPAITGPRPRTKIAEQIQEAIATWGVTKWLGELLKGADAR